MEKSILTILNAIFLVICAIFPCLAQEEDARDIKIKELEERIKALETSNDKGDKQHLVKEKNAKDTKIKEIEERIKILETSENEQQDPTVFEEISDFMDKHKIQAGLRMQSWYQFVDDGKSNDSELHDFSVRRFYLYLSGEVIPEIKFFGHVAADRIGQDGLDKPSVGLGTSIAVRDAWINFDLHEAFKIQVGRMYVPFTRFYGTESTFSMLTLDLPFSQGGVRGGIFYTSKVGRDDGIVVWGNPLDGMIQYRLGISEGVEGGDNPHDRLRFAGRVSLNLLEPEKKWFNKGSYFGKKAVLALGAGFDYQERLTLSGEEDQNNFGWTIDVFFDYPIGENGAITFESAFVKLRNGTQTLGYTNLTQGDDARIFYAQLGCLLPLEIGPGQFQPYFRYELVDVKGEPDTSFPSAGFNYIISGHNAKISCDVTYLERENETGIRNGNFSGKDQLFVTLQVSVGI